MRWNNEKRKILLVQTINGNLGDTVLADNDVYLLKKIAPNSHILRYSIATRDIGQIRYVDAVIFAGGGIIKVQTEKFWLYVTEIIREAQAWNVPVFLNAVGAEPFDPEDNRCLQLKEVLNLPCVKGISVRDDLASLRQYITNPDLRIRPVFDPAVWCRYTYRDDIEKRDPGNEVIGLGIVREKLFSDYGHPEIDRSFQLDFWKELVSILEAQGKQWRIFTNGATGDERFAREVLAYIGHGEKLPAPLNAQELIKNISTFSGIIGGRMHSNIIAYSLGIPSVGFIWNQKLRFWGEKIKRPERFLPLEQLTAANAADALCAAVAGRRTRASVIQRHGVYKELRRFVCRWCTVREKQTEYLNYKGYLLATALGGIDQKYKNTNTQTAFQQSLNSGYCNFELDLRLTSDRKLVCVNRWHPETFRALGMSMPEEATLGPLTEEAFAAAKYYDRYPTMTFQTFLDLFSAVPEKDKLRVVLDIGRPSEVERSVLFQVLTNYYLSGAMSGEHYMIRMERKKDVEEYQTTGLPFEIIYFMPKREEEGEQLVQYQRKILNYCKKNGIHWISMQRSVFTDELAELIKEYQMQTCIFGYVKTSDLIQDIKRGATLVGSHIYSVDYMKHLTRE